MSCEYCDGSKKPITTEVDGDGYMTVYDADPEYHVDGFTLDVYRYYADEWLLSFNVPCCPWCGRRLGEVGA